MLKIEHVSIDLDPFHLRDVCLEIERGEYLCLVGPTGAGKTILLECVMGLHIPKRGSVLLEGSDVTALPPEARAVGYVPQDYALFPHMSVFDNIAYGLVEHRVDSAEVRRRVEDAAELLGIAHLLGRRPATLSGGEAQRTALGRALVLRRDLLLMDEPFGALDQVTKRQLFHYLRTIHRKLDLTVLHVTHDFSEAYGLATKVAVVLDGAVCQVGSLEDVFLRPRTQQVARFLGIPNVWERRELASQPQTVLSRIAIDAMDRAAAPAVCIPADGVQIGPAPADPTRNGVTSTIGSIQWQGAQCEVGLDAGVQLVATIPARALAELGASVGDVVAVHIDPEDVHPMAG
jgi:molybdate/tungstate transport system ATP-binding protein